MLRAGDTRAEPCRGKAASRRPKSPWDPCRCVAGRIRIVLFAQAREAVGRARLERAAPAEGTTAALLLDELVAEFPRLSRVLSRSRLVVNGEYVQGRSARLKAGDELAIHPPYSGG